ncbi:hypothetical protein [Ruegeria arenilitoris]|uniref:hypothetical protein n=1 Tax=Ruegeria arenilitoris TaxID=1173585 RepID=UPI0014808753|nr:hypothetical protein [Ruegeria arenilitoris]
MARLLILVLGLLFAGCSTPSGTTSGDVAGLTRAIQNLGPDVDPQEAARAAQIAHDYALQLRAEYRVTDPAIIHNAKVINGFRERGLCNDWAEDILKRLRKENFRTLDLHWITSPPTPFRIIHHSAAISAKGDGPYDAIVLDGWRNGGHLFWAPVREDTRYNWRPRMEVRAELLAQ